MSEPSRAVLTDPERPGFVVLDALPMRPAGPDEVTIDVECFSLNRGELKFAQGKPAGSRIGWDVAGTVAEAAHGFEEGTRVVAFVAAQEGWAERVAVPKTYLAPIPDAVSSELAAALPVAAGTALAAV
ncbi:MAG: alcohol dehydrogenase, partial [Myxococcota bacterium]